MSRYLDPTTWEPVDGMKLEENALLVAKSSKNHLVVAGPGAGKTELLAQRACFLLQTNTCPFPRKILAISFKRDAASNLAERVSERLGKEMGTRFTSMTFDAFAKSLVDRFGSGLPEEYRPNAAYEISNDSTPKEAGEIFSELVGEDWDNLNNSRKKEFIRISLGQKLPVDENQSNGSIYKAVLTKLIKDSQTPILTFPLAMHLATYLLECNPILVSFLRKTYSHIFLDEFQDTTQAQFDLLRSAFHGSDAVITAVGDEKQRIMLWAGAMKDAFTKFQNDYSAEKIELFMNFRSAPRLIALQNHLANSLMGSEIIVEAGKDWTNAQGNAAFWTFSDEEQEAAHLSKLVNELLSKDGWKPRDICFLFKQRVDHYSAALIHSLKSMSIEARAEDQYQLLLKQPLVQFLINICIDATGGSQEVRDELLDVYRKLHGVDEEDVVKLEKEVVDRINTIPFRKNDWKPIKEWLMNEIEKYKYEGFKDIFPYYNSQKIFDQTKNRFFSEMEKYFSEWGNLKMAIEAFRGENSIPLMTIHKSKGLEFKAVFFIGFEDQQFWNYRNNPSEDTCAFFVALSRAKEEVYFTFCKKRNAPPRPWEHEGRVENRSISTIKPLIDGLTKSGIVTEEDFSP